MKLNNSQIIKVQQMTIDPFRSKRNTFFNPSKDELICEIEHLKTLVVHLKKDFQDERHQRKLQSAHLYEQVRNIQIKNNKSASCRTRTSITSSRASFGSRVQKKEDTDIQEDEILDNQLARCLSQNRLSVRQYVRTQNSIKQDFNLLMCQFSQFKNEIKLEIAGLRDNVSDLDMNLQQCLTALGGPRSIKLLSDGLAAVEDRTDHLQSFYQKSTSQIQLIKDHIDDLNSRIVCLSELLPQQVSRIDLKLAVTKEQIDTSQIELNEYLSRKLNKMIESYNLNFEDVDRSITQIKEVLADVVNINKVIKEKIGVRLSNTVDTDTFQRTIDVLNESFQTTYLMNNQRIKEMHERDCEVENELYQMKQSLDYLQSDIGYTHSRLRKDEFDFEGDNEIENLPIEQTSADRTQQNGRFHKKTKITHNQTNYFLKKGTRHKTSNSEDSHETRDNEKAYTLADELRELELQ